MGAFVTRFHDFTSASRGTGLTEKGRKVVRTMPLEPHLTGSRGGPPWAEDSRNHCCSVSGCNTVSPVNDNAELTQADGAQLPSTGCLVCTGQCPKVF